MQELWAQAGDQIVITKSVGLSGTYALFQKRYEELHSRYAVDFLEKIADYPSAFSVEPEYTVLAQQEWSACVEASYGGIFGALFRLGYDSGLGLRVELSKIPIRQQVIETAAYFEINPYLLHSAGSLVVACPNSFSTAPPGRDVALFFGNLCKNAFSENDYYEKRKY